MFRVLCLFLFSISIHAETLSLCAYVNWSPWIYSKGDSYDGILIEQLEVFRQKYPSIKLEIKEINNWKRCQADVASGRVSMLLGANKTPERELIYNYLPEPAFINRTTVGAYAAKDNEIGEVNSLNDLRKHTLSKTRGNSFGEEIDSFVQSLEGKYIFEVSTFAQAIKLVGIKRADYFLRVDSSYKSTIREHHKKFPNYSQLEFKKIYAVQRKTPVYFAFGKNTGNYAKYADKWLNALKHYHANVMIDERIRHHKQVSGN